MIGSTMDAKSYLKLVAEEMEKIDPELAKSEWIFPTDEILNNSQVFRPLTPEEQAEYAEAFGRVIQG